MAIVDGILPEFDHEFANTRKSLERIPDAKFDWKPHPKSWPMKDLGSHLANIPSWMTATMDRDSLDVAGPEGESFKPPPVPGANGPIVRD